MQEKIKITPFIIIKDIAYYSWGMFWVYNFLLSTVLLLGNMSTLPLYAKTYVWSISLYGIAVQWWQLEWKYDVFFLGILSVLNCYIISLYFPPERYFLFNIGFIRNIFY